MPSRVRDFSSLYERSKTCGRSLRHALTRTGDLDLRHFFARFGVRELGAVGGRDGRVTVALQVLPCDDPDVGLAA